MTVHKLSEDFYEFNYSLIAIHSSLESYRLAYFLNGCLGLQMKRLQQDLVLYKETAFPVYEWVDPLQEVQWSLLVNKVQIAVEHKVPALNMFGGGEMLQTQWVVPEYSGADYLFKVDNQEGKYPYVRKILGQIKTLPQVITAYELEPEQLRSKNNLIFLANA